MRKTLFSYIAKEMLLYFFISFLFFFFIFFVNQILLMAEEILSKKARLYDVLLLIFFSLPSIIATAAPFAALVGTLMGIGRLVSDREIVIMNALGVPVRFIMVPVFLVGILISIVSFMTNDVLLPAGTIQFNRLYKKILTSTPALELESNSIKRNQNAVVISGSIVDENMDSILLIDSDSEGNRRIVAAPSAEIKKSDSLDILMTLKMDKAVVASFNRDDKNKFDVITSSVIEYNILTKNLMSSYSGAISPREMSSRDLFRELKKKELNSVTKNELKSLNIYRMEFHKKFTIPFAAFFFTILAFPLGLTAKTNGQSTGFILGLIIAIIYWVILFGGQTLSSRLGFNGALMMWIPDTVLFILGVSFLGRRLFH
jgi:lipopolysaccharide export system permease protein